MRREETSDRRSRNHQSPPGLERVSESFGKHIIWLFPKIKVPQNGWFIMENPENPIEMDDLGVPLFSETSIYWLVVSTPSEKYSSK